MNKVKVSTDQVIQSLITKYSTDLNSLLMVLNDYKNGNIEQMDYFKVAKGVLIGRIKKIPGRPKKRSRASGNKEFTKMVIKSSYTPTFHFKVTDSPMDKVKKVLSSSSNPVVKLDYLCSLLKEIKSSD